MKKSNSLVGINWMTLSREAFIFLEDTYFPENEHLEVFISIFSEGTYLCYSGTNSLIFHKLL